MKIKDAVLRKIVGIFIGDVQGYYSYKSGSALVDFFNTYFSFTDVYGSGFSSRWFYAQEKLKLLTEKGELEVFFKLILDRKYIMADLEITEVEALKKIELIINEFNKILDLDNYCIIRKDTEIYLTDKNKELILVGNGGFANVYKQQSTGIIVKKLNDESLINDGIRSRFKREYEITKSLSDISGIITVYDFDDTSFQYTMEPADATLEEYFGKYRDKLSEENKEYIIRCILTIMSKVHDRNVIHRDLSPTNTFVINRHIKIADFGLGKDLTAITSHQTKYTNHFGQYYYCAPEQKEQLKDGDKKSDVYSLGKIINFIMTGSSEKQNHTYRNVVEKCTNNDPSVRYEDAAQVLENFEKCVTYHHNMQNRERVLTKIKNKNYDSDVENYISELTSENISKSLLTQIPGFQDALLWYMKATDERAQNIVQCIKNSFEDVCNGSFEANDVFACFAEKVLRGKFPYIVQVIAAEILSYVAWYVNRYNAQHIVEDLVNEGIDPTLEDIIKSRQ